MLDFPFEPFELPPQTRKEATLTEFHQPSQAIHNACHHKPPDDNTVYYLCIDNTRSAWAAIKTWIPEDCFQFFANPDYALVCYFTPKDLALIMNQLNPEQLDAALRALAEKVAIPIITVPILAILQTPEGSKEPS